MTWLRRSLVAYVVQLSRDYSLLSRTVRRNEMIVRYIGAWKWSNHLLRRTKVAPIICYSGNYDVIRRVGVVYPSQPGSVRPTGEELLVSLDNYKVDPRGIPLGTVLTMADHLEDGWSLIQEGVGEVARGDWE